MFTERMFETPYIQNWLVRHIPEYSSPRILEIGNVSYQYFERFPNTQMDVIDLYEHFEWVRNEDIRYYKAMPYDLIFSISTLEHVGENIEKEAYGIIDALLNTFTLLADGGRFIFTVPINYNKPMDMILNNVMVFDSVKFFKRISEDGWVESNYEDTKDCIYGQPYIASNDIRICEYSKCKIEAG